MRLPLHVLSPGAAWNGPLFGWLFVACVACAPVASDPPSDSKATTIENADTAPAESPAVPTVPKQPHEPSAEIPKVTRKLPTPPATTSDAESDAKAESDPKADGEASPREVTREDLEDAERPTAEFAVLNAFEPPPQARALSRNSALWIDPKLKRVYADGYVIMNRGMLEMFACPMHTKEHESVVATLAKSSQVHAALLAVGAISGTPARYSPEFLPPTGQRIRIWVSWLDKDGKYQVADARQWIRQGDTTETMQVDWVFAGSGFWKDEDTGKEHYQADSGDMICVSNFGTAMLDVPIESSAHADSLVYSPYTERIPERGTPIRLTLIPIPVPSDDPADKDAVDTDTAPTSDILTKKISPPTEPTPAP